MPIYDTYSKRLRRSQQAGQPDVFQYEVLPVPLRVQLGRVLRQTFGNGIFDDRQRTTLWDDLRDLLIQEIGVDSLASREDADDDCIACVRDGDVTHVLDLLELACVGIERIVSDWTDRERRIARSTQTAEDAISEINTRLVEHGVGYQYQSGQLVRVDSQLLHAEVVKPALLLLSDDGFEGPNKEFLAAHAHYRHGDHEAALTEALKAFESTMKAICDARTWPYASTDTASKLIAVLFSNKLLPDYLQSEVTGVRTTLECGVPTIRNKSGGHGAGATPRVVPGYFASYALHLTAANIVLLVEAHKALR